MDYIYHYNSPLGSITLSSDGKSLCGLWFDGQKYFASTLENKYQEKNLQIFRQTAEWLDIYFDGKVPTFTPALNLRTTGFRKSVWEILLTIPYGKTLTYGEIASRLAIKYGKERMSAQAVGGAVGHNAISLIIPCHRVIGADGNLTGYAGGIDKKLWLLKHEKADVSGLFIPKIGTAL